MFGSVSLTFLVVALSCWTGCAQSVKALYLFKDPALSNNTAIKTSGFNTVILFALNVQPNGSIVYPLSALGGGSPDVLLIDNGEYVGGSEYADIVQSFKTGDTNINRVEATVGPATLFRKFINKDGTGSSTILYRSMAALKAAWNLDAVNNDDESLYDVHSTVSFAKMLGEIGYKYTTAPYTNEHFWKTIARQINGNMTGLLDRNYLQCYDGGASNDPGQWQDALEMEVVPLLWVTNEAKPYDGSTPAQARKKFKLWSSGEMLAGGGFWNDYDIEQTNSSYTKYANVLNTIFG